jgi:hypothetical protein
MAAYDIETRLKATVETTINAGALGDEIGYRVKAGTQATGATVWRIIMTLKNPLIGQPKFAWAITSTNEDPLDAEIKDAVEKAIVGLREARSAALTGTAMRNGHSRSLTSGS